MATTMTMTMPQRGEAMSGVDLLHPEIWRQILIKLPAKSIPRCRSVCKTWYSLISSPNFIADHAAQTLDHSTSHRVLVLRYDWVKPLHDCISRDESFAESHELEELPEQLRSGFVRIVGSCNGLICLFKFDKDTKAHSILIWNPSIRKSVLLPSRPLYQGPGYDMRSLLGFGFDSDNGDYKVLRTGYVRSRNSDMTPVVSEVFDLRKGVWRGITPPMAPRNAGQPALAVYLHGNLHWVGVVIGHPFDYFLVSFNLSSEVSQRMEMPDDHVRRSTDQDYSVLVNNGLLSVALPTGEWCGRVCRHYISVWSMREYGVAASWTKLFNIEVPYASKQLGGFLYKSKRIGLLRFWENGEVVIGGHREGEALVVYNPENKTSIALLETKAFIVDVCFYKESLALL